MNTSNDHPNPATPPPSWRSTILGWFGTGEPRVHRGPFTRWPRLADAVLALVVLTGSLLSVALSALPDGEDDTLARLADSTIDGGAIVLLALESASLLWRRRRPVAVIAVVLACVATWALAGYGDGNDLAVLAAVYAVGRYTNDPRTSLTVLCSAIAITMAGTIVDPAERIDIAPALVLPATAWYLGRRVRNRGDYLALLQERSDRAEADQLARARQAVVDERSRIARELHDVVAHQVSMMTVQAGAAKTIARHDIDSAIDAMADVEQAGRQALGELRHLLGVLRADTNDPDHLGPQPGLADIAELADHLTHTGADVTLTIGETPKLLPASVDLSTYRIVQEAVTNIIRHAGPHPTVDITVGVDRDHLVIETTNTTEDTSRTLPQSGYGIAGMNERAALLGGTLSAGPLPPDRFRVLARLPLGPENP